MQINIDSYDTIPSSKGHWDTLQGHDFEGKRKGERELREGGRKPFMC